MPLLIATTLVLPLLAACLSIPARSRDSRRILGVLTGSILILLSPAVYLKGPCSFSPHHFWDHAIHVADYLLLLIVLGIAARLGSRLSVVFIVLQLILLPVLEFGIMTQPSQGPKLAADALSLVMALVVNGIGGVILIYSPAYLRLHEQRLQRTNGPERSFFFFMILFLGAMNGVIFANDALWLFFFWELTTVCSFALIAHDRTTESLNSALRALWMTMLGGASFLIGLILIYGEIGSLSLDRILQAPAGGMLLPGAAFLCLAGFSKAAQAPFQKWLIGAMVAPAPVSALLHSSTMVKAGVFLILRLMPLYSGTLLGTGIALVGVFSFLSMGALAISQKDSKRILAYSTILNLGLIIACAGFGTPGAAAAAVLLLVFHAMAKALLFLCVGAVELKTGIRDLDALQGLGRRMPLTTFCLIIGILALLLPPFGVVAGKWLLLKAAAAHPLHLFFLTLGMAFHLLLYARWAGDLLCRPYTAEQWSLETQPWTVRLSLAALTLALLAASPLIHHVFSELIAPVLTALAFVPPEGQAGRVFIDLESFQAPLLAVGLGLAVLAAALICSRMQPKGAKPAYVCGAQAEVYGEAGYKGPFNRVEASTVQPYFFSGFFERRILSWTINLAAVCVLLLLFAGSVWSVRGGL